MRGLALVTAVAASTAAGPTGAIAEPRAASLLAKFARVEPPIYLSVGGGGAGRILPLSGDGATDRARIGAMAPEANPEWPELTADEFRQNLEPVLKRAGEPIACPTLLPEQIELSTYRAVFRFAVRGLTILAVSESCEGGNSEIGGLLLAVMAGGRVKAAARIATGATLEEGSESSAVRFERDGVVYVEGREYPGQYDWGPPRGSPLYGSATAVGRSRWTLSRSGDIRRAARPSFHGLFWDETQGRELFVADCDEKLYPWCEPAVWQRYAGGWRDYAKRAILAFDRERGRFSVRADPALELAGMTCERTESGLECGKTGRFSRPSSAEPVHAVSKRVPPKVAELARACREGDLASARRLLDQGVPADVRHEPDDATMLMHAARGGHLAIVQLLMARGADPSLLGDNDRDAIHWAVFEGRVDVAQYLVKRDPGAAKRQYGNGTTLLMGAAKGGFLPLIDALVAAGADVDARDGSQRWVLSYAEEGPKETRDAVIARLIEHGAQPPPPTWRPGR